MLRGSACAAKLCEGSHWADEHARGGQQRTGPKLQPGAINSELLVRVPGALPLVVGLLDGATGGDFYVAYYTVQLLTALGAGNMPRLQEVRALLASLDMERQHHRATVFPGGAHCVKACRQCWRPQWAAQG